MRASSRVLMAFAACALAANSRPGQAQSTTLYTISGTVREASLHVPLPSATVQLIDSTGQRLAATITDSSGHFRLHPPAPGTYRVRALRLGLIAMESPLLLVGDSAVTIDLELTRGAQLDSMTIVGERIVLLATQQLIHGRLIDDDTGQPLDNGTIELRAGKKVVATTQTDRNGFFRLVTPSPGTFALRGRRIGYLQSQQDQLRMRIGDTVRIEFRLSRRVAVLAPVMVTASRKRWDDLLDNRDGLYDRMQRFANQRHAQFILTEAIDTFARKGYSTGQMLERLILESQPRGQHCNGSRVYIDGRPFLVTIGGPSALLTYEQPSELDFVEVFTFPAIPSDFVSPDVKPGQRSPMVPPCRVVNLWLRPRKKLP